MPDPMCPRCGALLSEELLAVVDAAFECPDCGAQLQLADVAPELLAARRREDADVTIHRPPKGSRLQCRTIGQQLVIYLPPGSGRKVRPLGCFAAFWLAIVAVISVAAVFSDDAGHEPFLPLMLLPFWLVGLGMLYLWVRNRFGKTYVLVEPDRIVRKFELFGRERYHEYPLDGTSRAQLVESYRENEKPVYAVAVSSPGGEMRFGTFLSDDEKPWLVKLIEAHLRRPPPPAT